MINNEGLEAAKEDLAKLLEEDFLYCSRVWEAWSYGTMTEEDFSLISEDPGVLEDIASTSVSAYLKNNSNLQNILNRLEELVDASPFGVREVYNDLVKELLG